LWRYDLRTYVEHVFSCQIFEFIWDFMGQKF